eukprot:661273-Rhodomonas_salina.1
MPGRILCVVSYPQPSPCSPSPSLLLRYAYGPMRSWCTVLCDHSGPWCTIIAYDPGVASYA